MKIPKVKALALLYSFIFISALIQSCCTNTYKIGSTSTIEAFYQNEFNMPLDTAKKAFVIEARFEAERTVAVSSSGIVSQATATSCAQNFLNTLDSESFKLTLDREFEFDSTKIAVGDNLLDLPGIETEFNVEWGHVSINISEEFTNNSIVSQGDYLFLIKGETSDGVQLEAALNLFLDL